MQDLKAISQIKTKRKITLCVRVLTALICVASLPAGCAVSSAVKDMRSAVKSFAPVDESQAIVRLAGMLSEKEVSEIAVEWTQTDPNVPAPNSLTYDNYNFSLTLKTPSGTTVYGPVKREVIQKLAARVQAGEAVKVSEVTKHGAKVIRSPANARAKRSRK